MEKMMKMSSMYDDLWFEGEDYFIGPPSPGIAIDEDPVDEDDEEEEDEPLVYRPIGFLSRWTS